jgi:hypothetical protein
MINVEPRHGVAHDIFNMLLNSILRAKYALCQEITLGEGFRERYKRKGKIEDMDN